MPLLKSKKRLWPNLKNRPFFIRLLHWEYWPLHLIYTPIYLYWLYLSLRARAFAFFTAANPGIELGGIFGESKMDILNKIPTPLIPKTLFLASGTSPAEIQRLMARAGLDFPIILKPDVGERGFLVEKIKNEADLRGYLNQHPIDLILQEYIDYPEEVSILYYRFPDQAQGAISSVTLKKYLSVTGDGRSTLLELIKSYPRARLQLKKLQADYAEKLQRIPEHGEKVELVAIGNHSRGTLFLNGNHLIDEQLLQTFDWISHQLDGIYFGRFDIKCKSFEDLRQGKNFSILEINGVKAEPTHIYEPGFSIVEAYRVLFRQWNIIFRISMANKAMGVDFIPFSYVIDKIKAMLAYRKALREAQEAVVISGK